MILFAVLKQSYINKKHLSLSKDEIALLQRKKFRALVAHVAQHSPYYQHIIKDHHIDPMTCAPQDFPILTKEKLLTHFDTIVTDRRITKAAILQFLEQSKNPSDLFLDTYLVLHTSGSSGTVSYFVSTQDEFVKGVAPATRAYGLRLFQRLGYVAATKGHYAGVTMINTARSVPFLYKDVQMFDINSPFDDIVEALNTMQPTVLSGYAFALRKLAQAQQKGTLSIHPSVLQSGGEPLSVQDKTFIQQVFRAPVVNIYASSEHGIMGVGRDSFGGMYLMEDNLIFEIHPTHTIVTNLYNYTLPLIRYRMSDRLEPIQDTKQLMPFLKIQEVVGRNEQVPVFLTDTGGEDFLSPAAIEELFVKNLNSMQMHVESKRSFTLKVILEPGISKKERESTVQQIQKELRHILALKRMTAVKTRVEMVERIWADQKTGKFTLIVIPKELRTS